MDNIDYSKYGAGLEATAKPENGEIDYSRYGAGPEVIPESLGKSALLAIPRLAVDAGDTLYKGAKAIPGYYEKAKTEVPALARKFIDRDFSPHNIAQGLAGVNEGINALGQFPRAVAGYGENRLNLLPKGSEEAVKKWWAPDTSKAINEIFGEPKDPGETAIRGLGRNIVPLASAAKLARIMPHLTKYGATRALNSARKLAEKRDIGKINIDPTLIKDARQFLPTTSPNRKVLKEAKGGDYNSLFRLQSDIGQNSADYAKSKFSAAERSHGKAGLQTRNALLNAIHDELKSQGHNDISELLRKGQNDYRKYMKFKPWRNALGATALAGTGITGIAMTDNPIIRILKNVLSKNML
jgi:hypothetical protein